MPWPGSRRSRPRCWGDRQPGSVVVINTHAQLLPAVDDGSLAFDMSVSVFRLDGEIMHDASNVVLTARELTVGGSRSMRRGCSGSGLPRRAAAESRRNACSGRTPILAVPAQCRPHLQRRSRMARQQDGHSPRCVDARGAERSRSCCSRPRAPGACRVARIRCRSHRAVADGYRRSFVSSAADANAHLSPYLSSILI